MVFKKKNTILKSIYFPFKGPTRQILIILQKKKKKEKENGWQFNFQNTFWNMKNWLEFTLLNTIYFRMMFRLINEKLLEKNYLFSWTCFILSRDSAKHWEYGFLFPCRIYIYWKSLHLFLSERVCSCTS